LYLTQGHTDAALDQLKKVVTLQPKDTISASLIKRLEGNNPPAGAGASVRPSNPPAPARLTAPATPVKEGRFEGTWTARPNEETTITLAFPDQGKFTWKVAQKGQNRQLQGRMTSGNGLLTLVQDQGPPMVGNVTWIDESHFVFKLPAVGPDDPGLSFSKES
jgi:hypothetical protein